MSFQTPAVHQKLYIVPAKRRHQAAAVQHAERTHTDHCRILYFLHLSILYFSR